MTGVQIGGATGAVFFIGYLAVCLKTGMTLDRARGVSTRQDNPITYWVSIGFIAFMAVVCAAIATSALNPQPRGRVVIDGLDHSIQSPRQPFRE